VYIVKIIISEDMYYINCEIGLNRGHVPPREREREREREVLLIGR